MNKTTITALGLALLASSCVYVRIRGDFLEEAWLEEIIHDSESVPASFHHGQTDFELDGFIWNHQGRLEVDFGCDPEELDDYVQSVRDGIEERIRREGGEITSVEQTGEHAWKYNYYDDGEHRELSLAVTEQQGESYPYRLELEMEELF